MGDDAEQGGLHIDSDWKTEAAREKERLTAEEQATPRQTGTPEASFMELVNLLAMQAAVLVAVMERRSAGMRSVARMLITAMTAMAKSMWPGASLTRLPESWAKKAKYGILIPEWWKTPAEAKRSMR